MADWETRSLFTSYRARYLNAAHFGNQFMQAARVGFAPYEGDTGDLHTWLMVEIDHRPSDPDSVTATPLVRFFKGPLLVEAGYNITVNQRWSTLPIAFSKERNHEPFHRDSRTSHRRVRRPPSQCTGAP